MARRGVSLFATGIFTTANRTCAGASEASEEADEPLEAVIDALKPGEAALSDSVEEAEPDLKLDLEDALDATRPKVDVVADRAQELLTSL